LTDAANAVLDSFAEAKQAYDIFVEKKSEMEQYRGYDKYYHAKANCEATELGTIGELSAMICSVAKEIRDLLVKVYLEKKEFISIWQDCMRDLKADWYGIQQAKEQIDSEKNLEGVYDIFKKKID